MIDPHLRDRRSRRWKRRERGAAMELWQMDIVGGFPQADGSSAKALTGIDDHSRMCVCARLMARERTRAVCDGLHAALLTYGAPEQILTDNGKVFTGRFNHPPVEVLFDRICRESGIEHLLTQPRSPTTTCKIERFHRSMRAEFLSNRAAFVNLQAAQRALDEWVDYYNTTRPHQSLDMATPAQRFSPTLNNESEVGSSNLFGRTHCIQAMSSPLCAIRSAARSSSSARTLPGDADRSCQCATPPSGTVNSPAASASPISERTRCSLAGSVAKTTRSVTVSPLRTLVT